MGGHGTQEKGPVMSRAFLVQQSGSIRINPPS
jgi:hypothetical protein